MATTPTQDAVPSESPRDLKFNAGKIDEFVTSLALQYIDRFGQAHYTIEGINALAKQVINQLGWVPFGTFQDGATLTNPNQTLKDNVSGEYYRWDGALPKTVTNGSTPANSGGVGVGAWVTVGDGALRTMLASSAGANSIGSTHRGTLALDLNAIDRRPDGYPNGITSVLSNGNDVVIGSDTSISSPILPASNNQITGAGGNLLQKTTTAAGMRIESNDSSDPKQYVVVNNLRSTGSTLSTEPGNEGYAVFLRNTKYTKIIGVSADQYTGGVAAGTSKSLIVRDVIAHDTTFHPLNPSTRDGRGGYGVITDNINDSLIDGVILDVGSVDNGRHVLYVSTGGYSDTSGNRNFIATNLIGKYLGKDDRNFWGVNVRKSTIFNMGSIVIDGANGGVAFNPQDGVISDFILHDLQLDIIKYQDGVPVYGVTTQNQAGVTCSRFLISNFNIRLRPKSTDLTGEGCVGLSLSYQDGLLTNGVISTPSAGNPILINDGANNTTISNIHDNIIPGYSGPAAAMITFTGAAVNNISVKNVTTSRAMFSRLQVVTDLTVDFQRKARISVSGGVATKIDTNAILGAITLNSTGMTIVFPSHVTQASIENVAINCVGAYQAVINSYTSKVLTISTYTISGAVLNPTTTAVIINIILSS